jgi:hypothetical protein
MARAAPRGLWVPPSGYACALEAAVLSGGEIPEAPGKQGLSFPRRGEPSQSNKLDFRLRGNDDFFGASRLKFTAALYLRYIFMSIATLCIA